MKMFEKEDPFHCVQDNQKGWVAGSWQKKQFWFFNILSVM
jgi:hypothetical protein